MNTSTPGKSATFDPARFRVEKQQHFKTPGHFTIFFDGKMVGTYKALPDYRIDAIVKRLWERGDALSGIRPLWGGKAIVSADSDDVITLTTSDRKTLLCRVQCSTHAEGGTHQFWFYDPEKPVIDEHIYSVTGPGVPIAAAQLPVPQHLRKVIGSVEWNAAIRFAAYLQSVAHFEKISGQLSDQEVDAERKFDAMRTCAMRACEVQSLMDFMAVRGTKVMVKGAVQYDLTREDDQINEIHFPQDTAFMIYAPDYWTWVPAMGTWSDDTYGRVMTPRWAGEVVGHLHPGSINVKTWIEPYTYRPAIYRERMTASPEEWIVREAKHACTDRFGQMIRATDTDTTRTNQAPRERG